MAKRKKWESESNGLSKYEEQRLKRIGENRGRLEAMGISQMASSLKLKKGSPPLKKEVEDEDEDEEYIPEDEREGGSSSWSEQDEGDFDLEKASSSKWRKRKVKSKSVKMKGRGVSGKKHQSEDEALSQAIALSLQQHHTAEASYRCANTSKAVKEDKGRINNTKSQFTSRLQMTEDEFIVHFFQLDEAGKGTVTKRDLERAALAHDFVWTDKELADMIHCFDTDRDGKLSLDDFRKIVVRCNMIKESESS